MKKMLFSATFASILLLAACGQDATESEESDELNEPVEDNLDESEE